MKEVKEDISDTSTPDEPGPSGLYSLKTQSDSPGVTSTPLQDKQLIPLIEAFGTADQVPKLTMAQILLYFIWRTAVDGFPNADSKSVSESAMNLSRCGHIQQIMVCTSDENIEFTGICRAEMKKKVQYKLALTASSATAAITHAECGGPSGKGNLATCKHIGARPLAGVLCSSLSFLH